MKKTVLLFSIAMMLLSCGGERKASQQEALQTIDSAYYHKADGQTECTVRASLPAERMNQAVGEWLDESLGGVFPGDPTDIQAIVDYYGTAMTDTLKNMAKEWEDAGLDDKTLAFEALMEHDYETDEFVTYTLSTYTDLGGAHPTSSSRGATFRKKDGRRVDWDMIASHDSYLFQKRLSEGLKDYFEVETDEQLTELLPDINIYNIPYPQTPPYFTKDGIVVIYQQYEIAPYAYGMPSFIMTYEEAKSYMTGWAKRMVK